MRTHRHLIATALAVVAIAGCGSPARPNDAAVNADAGGDGPRGDGPGGDGAATATALEACQQLNEAQAQRNARCLGGAIADWRTAAAEAFGGMDCARYARHVSEGLVEYQRADLAACLARYTLACDQDPYPCYYEVLHGLVPDGQPCEDTGVCGTVSGCVNISGNVCGEICVRVGNETEACGLYCGTSTPCLAIPFCASGLFCVDSVCVKAKQLGEACGGPQQIVCRLGLGCDVDPAAPDGNGSCVNLAAGRACRDDAGCIATEFCLAGTCTPRRGPGASCVDAPDACGAFTYCDDSGSCLPAGHVGQACAPWPGTQVPSFCVSGFCDGTNCLALAPAGGSCAVSVCETGFSCDTQGDICQACAR